MAIERVNSVFDVPELKQEFDFFIKGMEGNQAAIVSLYKTIEGYKGANFKTLTSETEKLTVAVTENAASLSKAEAAEKKYQEAMARSTMETVQFAKTNVNLQKTYQDMSGSVEQNIRLQIRYKKEMEELKNQQKELSKAFGGTTESSAKLAAKQIEVARAIEENKAASAELGRTIRLQVKEQIAAGGSLDEMKAKYDRLFQVMRGLSDSDRDSAIGQQLNADLEALSNNINEIQKKAGDFSKNVGRYQGSLAEPFKVLADELVKIRAQLSNMDQGSAGFDELIKQEKLLSQLTDGLNKEFSSTTMEIRALQKAAVTLGMEFGNNTEVFQKFKDQVGGAVDSMGDIQAQVKLAASDTRALDGMIGAAEGLAGAYSVAEGSAALFGNSSEALMQTMVKLQAVMSILQGLQAIRNAMQKESAAMDFLSTVRLKALAVAQTIYAGAVRVSSMAMTGFAKAILLTGIFTLIPLLAVAAKALYDFARASGDAAKEQERANEVSLAAVDSYAKEQVQLQQLTAKVKEGGLSFQEKQKVLKDYNETFGESIGKAKTFEEAEKNLITLGPAYIEMLQLQAEAHAAFDLAVEETKKKLKTQQEGPELGIMGSISASVRSAFGGIDAGFAYAIDKQQEQVKESETAAASFLKIQEDSQAKADAIKKKYGFKSEEDQKKVTKSGEDQAKKRADIAKREAQAIYETEMQALQMKADANKKVAESDTAMFTERIMALQDFQSLQEQIIKKERDFLLSNSDLTNNERAKITQDAQFKLADIVTQGFELRSAIRNQQLEKEKAEMEAMAQEMAELPEKLRAQATTSEETRSIADVLIPNDAELTERLAALTGRLKNQEITYEEYLSGVDELNEEYARRELSRQEQVLQGIISILQNQGVDVTDELTKLNDIKRQIYEKDAKNFADAEKTKEEKAKESMAKTISVMEQLGEISNNLFSAVGEALSIGFDKQKVAVEDLETTQQKAYENEVARINTSTATEAEKADKLKILEAERMAQKEANERKQRKIETERAKWQKAQDISSIISGTALAVVRTLAQGGPFAIALSVAVGALGAAQLARAIAAPLPKFEKGTDSAPGGYAITDEKGAEMYIEPGGKTYLGSDQGPVMRYLKPGTKVIPHNEVNQAMQAAMMANTARQLQAMNGYEKERESRVLDEIKEAIMMQTDATIREMRRSKKQTKLVNNIDLGWGSYIQQKTFN